MLEHLCDVNETGDVLYGITYCSRCAYNLQKEESGAFWHKNLVGHSKHCTMTPIRGRQQQAYLSAFLVGESHLSLNVVENEHFRWFYQTL
jgi:hypothetical protein